MKAEWIGGIRIVIAKKGPTGTTRSDVEWQMVLLERGGDAKRVGEFICRLFRIAGTVAAGDLADHDGILFTRRKTIRVCKKEGETKA